MENDSDVNVGLSLNQDPEDGPSLLSVGVESQIKRKTDTLDLLATQTIITTDTLEQIKEELEFITDYLLNSSIKKQDEPAQILGECPYSEGS